ncbi:hypothetical protein ACFOKC_00130, partial [Halobacterium litoreum]
MPKVSLVLDDEDVEDADALVEDGEAASRSEAVRILIDRGREVEDLRTDLQHERARADDLQRQLAVLNEREDNV